MVLEMNKSVKLSVILPCYNVGKYLKKCIDSLLRCNINDVEIIMVDDGSTDDTSSIINDISNRYDNCHAYHKINGGVSSARNYGLRKASGKYISFIDPDDWVEPSIYIESIDIIETERADLVIFEYFEHSEKEHTNTCTWRRLRSDYNLNSNREIMSKMFPAFIGRGNDDIECMYGGAASINIKSLALYGDVYISEA